MGNTFFVRVPFLSLRELLSFFTLPLINCIQHLHAQSDLTRRLDKIEIMRRPVQGYPARRRQTIILNTQSWIVDTALMREADIHWARSITVCWCVHLRSG